MYTSSVSKEEYMRKKDDNDYRDLYDSNEFSTELLRIERKSRLRTFIFAS